jgi:hypothetical protein
MSLSALKTATRSNARRVNARKVKTSAGTYTITPKTARGGFTIWAVRTPSGTVKTFQTETYAVSWVEREIFGMGSRTYSPTVNKKAFAAGKTAGDTWAFENFWKRGGYEKKGFDKKALETEFERGVNAGIDEASAKRRKAETTRETREHAKGAGDKSQGTHKGYGLFKRDDGLFYSSLDRDTWRDTLKELRKDIDDFERGRRNPRRKAKSRGSKSGEKALYKTAARLAMLGAGGVPAVLLANPKKKVGSSWVVRSGDGTRFFSTFGQALKHINALKRSGTFDGERIEEFKRNPGTDAAAAAYREFHGREPEERIEFTSTHQFPAHTAAIGDLVELTIKPPKERGLRDRYVELADFGEAWLTRHPRMKQLYVEGGDQSIDLDAFGLDDKDPHEVEYLGELVRCVYFTRKDHLGKDGGEANYHHKFGKNELTLDKTELIKVGYHVPDEQLIFVGGGYEIPAEGIDG